MEKGRSILSGNTFRNCWVPILKSIRLSWDVHIIRYYGRYRPFVPSRVKIIGQDRQIVAGSLADYLKRHPKIDRRLGKDSRRSYLTTEKTELFDRMAGLFLKEEISSQRIFMC